MCKKIFIVLSLFFFCLPLSAALGREYFSLLSTPNLTLPLNLPGKANLLASLYSRERQLPLYSLILSAQNKPLNQQTDEQTPPNSDLAMLSNLLVDQLNGLIELQEKISALSKDNLELTNTLNGLKQIISDLRNDLEIAIDRIGDAEDGAIALLEQNDEIFNRAKLSVARINSLEQQLAAARKGSVAGFCFGAVSFGVGTPFFIEGVRQDNRTMVWAGAGTIGVSAAVWGIGHFIFNWW